MFAMDLSVVVSFSEKFVHAAARSFFFLGDVSKHRLSEVVVVVVVVVLFVVCAATFSSHLKFEQSLIVS